MNMRSMWGILLFLVFIGCMVMFSVVDSRNLIYLIVALVALALLLFTGYRRRKKRSKK